MYAILSVHLLGLVPSSFDASVGGWPYAMQQHHVTPPRGCISTAQGSGTREQDLSSSLVAGVRLLRVM